MKGQLPWPKHDDDHLWWFTAPYVPCLVARSVMRPLVSTQRLHLTADARQWWKAWPFCSGRGSGPGKLSRKSTEDRMASSSLSARSKDSPLRTTMR